MNKYKKKWKNILIKRGIQLTGWVRVEANSPTILSICNCFLEYKLFINLVFLMKLLGIVEGGIASSFVKKFDRGVL